MRLFPLLVGLVTAAGLGLLLRDRFAGLPSAAPTKPTMPDNDNDTPLAPPPMASGENAQHQGAAAIMRPQFPRVIGREGSPAELLYCLGVARYETNYGKGSFKSIDGAPVQNKNNWGSVHAKAGEPSTCASDAHSNDKRYVQCFKAYDTPEDGAADVVRHIMKHRPIVAEALADNPTLWRVSLAMRRTMYYGSWCLKAVKQYGDAASSIKGQKNPSTEGEVACEKEAVGLHVWRMNKETLKIASALGIPPIPEGTYDDARQWYDSRSRAA